MTKTKTVRFFDFRRIRTQRLGRPLDKELSADMAGSAMAKLLIVNADDFGLSPGINAGIIEGFEQGILTSASIMVNAPASEPAVQLAHAHDGLGIGVHLN